MKEKESDKHIRRLEENFLSPSFFLSLPHSFFLFPISRRKSCREREKKKESVKSCESQMKDEETLRRKKIQSIPIVLTPFLLFSLFFRLPFSFSLLSQFFFLSFSLSVFLSLSQFFLFFSCLLYE